jgi:hypothetical protein
MLPAVKEELSLINSILEVRDVTRIAKTAKAINQLQNTYIPYKVNAFLFRTLRELLRKGSDAYLSLEFGIKPLLSDIRGIYLSLVRLERRMNALISREGRLQTRHFGWVYNEYPDTDSPVHEYVGWPASVVMPGQLDTWAVNRSVRYSPSIFHAEIQFNYNFTGYQREHARILGLLDSLGINFNPAIIWNAIPWSFVVDWILKVQDYLDGFKMQNMEPQINIRRYLWSIKRKREIQVRKGISYTVPPYPRQVAWIPLPMVTETSYRRQVGLPASSSIELSGLNPKEFSLGAALVLVRRRRRST